MKLPNRVQRAYACFNFSLHHPKDDKGFPIEVETVAFKRLTIASRLTVKIKDGTCM